MRTQRQRARRSTRTTHGLGIASVIGLSQWVIISSVVFSARVTPVRAALRLSLIHI